MIAGAEFPQVGSGLDGCQALRSSIATRTAS